MYKYISTVRRDGDVNKGEWDSPWMGCPLVGWDVP